MSDCAEIGEAERCKHPTESLHKPYTQLPVKDVYSAPRLPNTTHHPLLFIDAEENVKKKKIVDADQFWQLEVPLFSAPVALEA